MFGHATGDTVLREAARRLRELVGVGDLVARVSTVAEGVEEPEQFELFRRAGCSGVQGFLIARPMPVDSVVALVESWEMQRAQV